MFIDEEMRKSMEGFGKIVRFSQNPWQTTELDLSNHQFVGTEFDIFVMMLTSLYCRLEKLNISGVGMTNKQVNELIEALKKNSTIVEIRCKSPKNPMLKKELIKLYPADSSNQTQQEESGVWQSDDDVAHSDGEVGPLGYYDYDSGPFID